MNDRKSGSVVVVGASLSGLMTGIALAKEGLQVTIVDKVSEEPRSGSGLQVDGGGFTQTKTEKLLKNLASGGKRSIQLWSSIESRLRDEAQADERINLRYNTRVQAVDQDEYAAWVITDQGEKIHGDLLIGADGHNSQVRSMVAPHKPDATFAGYIVWIATTDESDLPEEKRPGHHYPEVSMLESHSGFLFGSIISPANAVVGSASRRIGCTWYDNSRNDVFRHLGCVEGSVVHHSLKGMDIPEEIIRDLADQVMDYWSDPWKSAMLHALENRNLTGIPIKEYVPDQLVNGRIGLVGDAAHVPAPITASGFNASLQDAVDLGKCVTKGIEGMSGTKALKKYESLRLDKVRKMVESGKSYSRAFGLAGR